MYYNFPQNRKYMINKDLVVKLDSKIVETNGVDFDCDMKTIRRRLNNNKEYKSYTFKVS